MCNIGKVVEVVDGHIVFRYHGNVKGAQYLIFFINKIIFSVLHLNEKPSTKTGPRDEGNSASKRFDEEQVHLPPIYSVQFSHFQHLFSLYQHYSLHEPG